METLSSPLPGGEDTCDSPVGGGRGPGASSCRWSFLQKGWFGREKVVSQLTKGPFLISSLRDHNPEVKPLIKRKTDEST